MSASSKKKLRKEQSVEALTEKQQAMKKEAKKTKAYTIAFVVVMVAVLLVTAVTVIFQGINSSGVIERNTTALTVNDHKITAAELSYFYIDALNSQYRNWANVYGNYTSFYLQMMYGLDITKPLSSQVQDEATGKTWGDFFVDIAIDNAISTYAMCDKASADGFKLTDEQISEISNSMEEMRAYATSQGGFSNLDGYLKACYGNGSREGSFRAYQEAVTLSSAYQQAHSESLKYDDAQVKAYDDAHTAELNSYSYAFYSLTASQFRKGGTKGDNGITTYTDEEIAAGIEACKTAADSLIGAESIEKLDERIAALEINKDNEDVHSTRRENVLYTSVDETLREWVSDPARKAGDMTVITNETTSTAEDGTEKKTVQGYFVVFFEGSRDNTMPLSNVRHILVSFTGGTKDSNGNVTYSDSEKAAAKTKAEEILNEWKKGDATEDSFAKLATEKSDDTGSKENGGLYEDITPDTNFVEPFLDWSMDSHKAGDTGIVETPYGYHVMYYVGDDEMTYRHYMIDNLLRNGDMTEWYDGIVEAASSTVGNTSRINRNLTLATGY